MQRFRYIPPEETFPFKYSWPYAFVMVNLSPGGSRMLLKAKAWCETELDAKGERWDYVTMGRYMFVFRDYEDAFMFRMVNG